jgi:hypothetical protein
MNFIFSLLYTNKVTKEDYNIGYEYREKTREGKVITTNKHSHTKKYRTTVGEGASSICTGAVL